MDIAITWDVTAPGNVRVLGPHLREGRHSKAAEESMNIFGKTIYDGIMLELSKTYQKYNDLTVGEIAYKLSGGSILDYRTGNLKIQMLC